MYVYIVYSKEGGFSFRDEKFDSQFSFLFDNRFRDDVNIFVGKLKDPSQKELEISVKLKSGCSTNPRFLDLNTDIRVTKKIYSATEKIAVYRIHILYALMGWTYTNLLIKLIEKGGKKNVLL